MYYSDIQFVNEFELYLPLKHIILIVEVQFVTKL